MCDNTKEPGAAPVAAPASVPHDTPDSPCGPTHSYLVIRGINPTSLRAKGTYATPGEAQAAIDNFSGGNAASIVAIPMVPSGYVEGGNGRHIEDVDIAVVETRQVLVLQ